MIMNKNGLKAGGGWKSSVATVLALLLSVCLGVFLSKFHWLESVNREVVTAEARSDQPEKVLRYWSVCIDEWNPYGNLRTVNRVLRKLNYRHVNATSLDDWDLLWSDEYIERYEEIFEAAGQGRLKPHQRVNHIPGIYAIANKRTLGKFTTSQYLFPTFAFPNDARKFKKFSQSHPTAIYVEKNYDNRGVRIVREEDFDTNNEDKIYQLFMDKPFLIDGHAFDFGVFVLISSVNPLRIYRYEQEVFIRFCPKEYHPFDPTDTDKYVVDDDHMSAFEMPSFEHLYNDYDYTSKRIFEEIIRERGFDVRKFWLRIDDAISDVIQKNEKNMIKAIKAENYEVQHNFFELVRFDIILDENLHPYVMEINMSPNLTPADDRFAKNGLLYEQLVYNALTLVGGGSYDTFMSRMSVDKITVYGKNLATNFENCVKYKCHKNCDNSKCEICMPCISGNTHFNMAESYREHNRRGNFKRVFPGHNHYHNFRLFHDLSESNQIMIRWFEAKCESDESWC